MRKKEKNLTFYTSEKRTTKKSKIIQDKGKQSYLLKRRLEIDAQK